MSLRPRLPGAAHGHIARTRMAPGGQAKPYSQSPIRPTAGINRMRAMGVPPLPEAFYVDASLANEFTEIYEGGYFVCELVLTSGPSVTYSEPVPFVGTLPAHERLAYEYDLTAQYAGPWDYARIRWHFGDGSATLFVFDGEYGPPGTALEQDPVYEGRLIDPTGQISS